MAQVPYLDSAGNVDPAAAAAVAGLIEAQRTRGCGAPDVAVNANIAANATAANAAASGITVKS